MVAVKSKAIGAYKIGSDCELFLRNKESGKIITAEGIIQGDKKNPFRFDAIDKYYATSLDCVLAEFNIPPCTNAGEYYRAIQKAIRYIESVIPENLETVAIPAARLEEDQLTSEIANEFGCMPSLNAWTLDEIHPHPTGDNLRSAGFHIHIGYEDSTKETSLNLIKAMDVFLGIPSLLIEPENERKAVGYGCAGNARIQDYGGVEYRTLSSYFASSKTLIEWCFKQTEEAIKFVNAGRIYEIENFGDDIQAIINNNDLESAKNWIEKFKIKMPK